MTAHTTTPPAIRIRRAGPLATVLTLILTVAAPRDAAAQVPDPARCDAGQPRVEQRLQKGRAACLARAERREARGRDGDFEACEAREIARYAARMRRTGCDVEESRAAGPPRRARPVVRQGLVTLQGQTAEVQYEVIDDLAIFQGDIILGTAEEVAAGDRALRTRIDIGVGPAAAAGGEAGIQSHTRGDFGWSRAVIPFEIASDLSSTMVNRINSAVAHWNANTIVRLQARNGEADFVRFVKDDDGLCLSHAGKKGGMQEIRLDTQCSTGNVIHEIGHAVGLYHEQTRGDRDGFVVVEFENMEDDDLIRAQYAKGPFGSVDRDAFDFNSRLLYAPTAFSDNGLPTMTKLDGSTWTPNLSVLSTGDIVGVTRMVTGLNDLLTAKDKFRNKAANRCMDADSGGSGAAVSIFGCTGATRQRWQLYTHPRTSRKLLVNERSGLCLDVPSGSTTSGRDLIQFPCHGGTNQAFSFTDRPFPWDPWTIRSVGTGLCVALESTAAGGDVEQRTCNGGDQQKWFQELL